MLEIALVIIAAFFTSLLSLVGGILFLSDNKLARRIQKIGPAIAAAVLLWAVFGEIIPEALENNTLQPLHLTLLITAGFITCSILGWVLGHFHHHADIHHSPDKTHLKNRNEAITMLIVDTIHNAADGIVIGVSFIANPLTGLTTCLATIAHEIPQEVGDFSIMLKSKIPKQRIIKLQFRSALVLIPAALLAYLIGDTLAAGLPVILSLVAGFFLYIALSEIIYLVTLVRSRTPRQLRK